MPPGVIIFNEMKEGEGEAGSEEGRGARCPSSQLVASLSFSGQRESLARRCPGVSVTVTLAPPLLALSDTQACSSPALSTGCRLPWELWPRMLLGTGEQT